MDITRFVYESREKALQLGGYGTYRTQLSNQVASMRRKLGRSAPKNAKYSPKAPITAEDIGGNPEFAHLILLSCERAWAHAWVMKSTHAEDNAGRGVTGQTRRHIITKFHQAAVQAEGLAKLFSEKHISKATDIDILEARAYAETLAGTKQFEKHASSQRSSDVQAQKEKWESCLKHLSAAQIIYRVLLKVSKKDNKYREVLGDDINPSMRIAAYQSHIPRTVPVERVSREYFPQDDSDLVASIESLDDKAFDDEKAGVAGTDGAFPTTITWRRRKANIVDASIGQALAAISNAEEHLEATISSLTDAPAAEKAAAYDDVLTASQDAVDATRHAIEDHEKEGISESDSRMQDLRVTNLAVNYGLIGWRVGRNRVLIGDDDGLEFVDAPPRKPKRPRKDGKEWEEQPEGNGRKLARLRERVVLYDSILQSIDSVKELPGAAELSFREELDGKRAYFQALKCLNISHSHALLSQHRETLALLLRAHTLCTTALSKASPQPTPPSSHLKQLDIAPRLLQTLHTHLQNLVSHHTALVELRNLSENSRLAAEKRMTTSAPIAERLNEYPPNGVDLKNLVEYPPRVRAVPVKPLFLDVAFNYIEYPGRTTAVVNGEAPKGAGEPQEERKRGWFGWGARS